MLAVTGDALARARVDAGGTRLRLRALHVMGHGSRADRPRRRGQPGDRPRASSAATPAPSARGCATPVTAVYDAWWDKRAPERTPAASAAAATAARRRAIAGNWCAGAALDDDQLDIPGYQPAHGWRPAQGTGTATDLPLALRRHRNHRPGSHRRPQAGPAHPARSEDITSVNPPDASRAFRPSQERKAHR